MFITKKSLSRRTLLRGLGAGIALPVLDAMVPALAQSRAPAAPVRLAWFYHPNGIDMRHFTPAAPGPLGAELPRVLAPLAPYRADFNVISHLTAHWGRPLLAGAGDHGRALAAYMTGMEVAKEVTNLRSGISADQIAADAIGHLTRLPSLEIGLEEARMAGNCDNGYSCAYVYNVAWKTESHPLPPIADPRLLFERLFGADGGMSAAARERRYAMRASILDTAIDDTEQLVARLGGSDRRKLDEYLTSIREVERQVERAASDGMLIEPDLAKPFGVPADYGDYYRLMSDMLLLAFRADITRVATLMVGREGSTRPYPEIGIADGHHPLTHHRGDADMLGKVTEINVYHARLFAEFLGKLRTAEDYDGASLLDSSLIVYGAGIADGNNHTHDQLPTVLVGRGGGAVKTGRHLIYQRETPITNLYRTMVETAGASPEFIGDSTGRLDGLG